MNVYEADDDEEWRLVISEVTAFMEVISIGLDCEQFLFFWIIHVEERRTLSERAERQEATVTSALALIVLSSISDYTTRGIQCE